MNELKRDFTLTCSRPRRPIIITDEDLWDEMWDDENLNISY